MIYPFKKIVFDCRRATMLALKRDEGSISMKERLILAYHLLYCDPCKRFIKQSRIIDNAGGKDSTALAAFRLSDERRDSIEQALKKEE